MGRFGRKDAPRVVGFDFGPPGAAAPMPAAPAAAVALVAEPAVEPSPFAEVAAVGAAAGAPYPPPDFPPPAQPSTQQEPWAVAAPAVPAYPSPYSPGVELMPPAARSGGFRLGAGGLGIGIRVVVALIFVGGGWQGAQRVFASPLSTPEALGGYARDTSPEAEKVLGAVREGLRRVSGGNAALYSDERGVPVYLLIAGDDDHKSSGSMYSQHTDDIVADGGTMTRPTTVGRVTCGTATRGAVVVSTCFWSGSDSDGVLMTFGEVAPAELAPVAEEARRAVES